MLPGRWNTTFMKILYLIIIIVTLILICNSGDKTDDLKPSIMLNAWDFINSAYDTKKTNFEHMAAVRDYLDKRRDIKFSALGKVLFLNENRPPARNKQYKILMYKIGESWESRHLYYFGKDRHEPFEFCDVKNCVLSYNETDFDNADAVVFHLHVFNADYNTPTNVPRPPGQRWIFTSDESPHHTFMLQANDWFNYSGVFNWSMLYRMESDVPVAYGRIVPLDVPLTIQPRLTFKEKFNLLVPHAEVKRRDILVAIMSSNCWANNRMQYITELQKHISVDVYGGCAPENLREVCPWKGYGVECDQLRKYLFYLSFDNSNCNGYMTEKMYSHALKLGSVPVFMGMFQNQSDLLVPPNSYLHVDNFKNPEDLAKFILHINDTLEENYLKYHEWRKHFKSLSEDGYMGARSYHYCRLCEALNYNDESHKVYYKDDLALLLDPTINCHNPNW